MAIRHRNFTKNEPPTLVACGNCSNKVVHIQSVPISPTATQRVCDDCAPVVRYPHTDTDEAVAARLATFAAEWAAYERKSIYIASPLKFGLLQRLEDSILSKPRPCPEPPPTTEPESEPVEHQPSWEDIVDIVLDASAVVSNLDFAVPIDLREVVTAYQAATPQPAPILDITARIASKAAWNDEATRIARQQAGALVKMMKTWKPETSKPREEVKRVLQAAA